MRKVLACLAVVVVWHAFSTPQTANGCTIGVASGIVTMDGRPLLWKSRMDGDTGNLNHAVIKPATQTGFLYDFIGIKGTDQTDARMGINTVGLVTGNALYVGGGNSEITEWILGNCATVGEVRTYLTVRMHQPWSGGDQNRPQGSSAWPIIDPDGNAIMFETYPGVYGSPLPGIVYEYDCLDTRRQNPDPDLDMYGWVVRDNDAHYRDDGQDNYWYDDRYNTAKVNTRRMVQRNQLSALHVSQGAGGADNPEFLRYGPGRVLDTIALPSASGAIAATGVLPTESSELTTMWTALGRSNFTIAVPLWSSGGEIPWCLQDAGDDSPMAGAAWDMYYSAEPLHDIDAVQASTYPFERHLMLQVESELMWRWRLDTAEAVSAMPRVQAQMAEDAYSLMNCLRNATGQGPNNLAPTMYMQVNVVDLGGGGGTAASAKALTSDTRETGNTGYEFVAIADDDGSVVSYVWDFGDGGQATGDVVEHEFTEWGYYLVSCTITDDEGVSSTYWRYHNAGRCGGIQGIGCGTGDYCKFPIDTCNWCDHFGTCTEIPSTCPGGGTQVCGCNGVTYENECFAEMDAVSVDHLGACRRRPDVHFTIAMEPGE